MLTNLVRDLDDHNLSILHTQNGLVGVACVNPLQKQISRPGCYCSEEEHRSQVHRAVDVCHCYLGGMLSSWSY